MLGVDLSENYDKAPAPRHSSTLLKRHGGLPTWMLGVVLVAALVVPGLVAYAVSAQGEKVYAASSEILLADDASTDVNDEQAVSTQVQLMTSRALISPVADSLGMSIDDVTSMAQAEQVGSTQILRLTVTSRDQDEALRIAEALTNSYVERMTGQSAQLEQRDYLNARITDLRSQLAGAAAAAAAEEVTLDQQLLIDQIDDLQSRLTDVEIPAAAPVQLLVPAYVLSDPVSPQPLRAGIGGALAGLIFGAAALVLYSMRRASKR